MDKFRFTECDNFVSIDESTCIFVCSKLDQDQRDSQASTICMIRCSNIDLVRFHSQRDESTSLSQWFLESSPCASGNSPSIFDFDPRNVERLSPSGRRAEVVAFSYSSTILTCWALEFSPHSPEGKASLIMVLPNSCSSLAMSLGDRIRGVCIDEDILENSAVDRVVLSREKRRARRVMVYDANKGWCRWRESVDADNFLPACVEISVDGKVFAAVFESPNESVKKIIVSDCGVVWSGKRVEKNSLRVSSDGSHVLWRGVENSSPFSHAVHSRVYIFAVETKRVECVSDQGCLVIGSGFLDSSVWVTEQEGVSTLSSFIYSKENGSRRKMYPPITSKFSNGCFYQTESLSEFPQIYSAKDNLTYSLPISLEGINVISREWRHEKKMNLQGVMMECMTDSRRPNRDVVLYLHGGPAMSIPSFRSSAAYFLPLLSEGFRVLKISYAGSLGFGDEYAQCIIGAQGTRDLADVEAAIESFPGRIACVFGSSYGGFLTLHSLCKIKAHHVPCFVALYPYVSSRGCAMETGDFAWAEEYAPSGEGDVIPLLYSCEFSHISRPLLLLHGDADSVCPLSQSLIVYNVLKQRGASAVALVKYVGEGHGFKRVEVRRDSMQRITEFIKNTNVHDGVIVSSHRIN